MELLGGKTVIENVVFRSSAANGKPFTVYVLTSVVDGIRYAIMDRSYQECFNDQIFCDHVLVLSNLHKVMFRYLISDISNC